MASALLAATAAAGTLAHWTFDDTLNDSVGANHLVGVFGAPSFEADRAANAPGTKSLLFAPSTERVTVALSAGDNGFRGPTNDFTFELFFKTTQVPSVQAMIATTFDHTGFDTVTPNDDIGGWHLSVLASGKLTFHNRVGATTHSVASAAQINDGQWHHAAVTMSATNLIELFLDGVSQGTVQGLGTDPQRNGLRFGASHTGGGLPGFFYGGSIDEARLSSGVLAASAFLSAVPEPGAVGLLGAGITVLATRQPRRHRQRGL